MTREKESQPGGLVARLVEIQKLRTGELQREVSRLTGRPCLSFNKPFLQRKLSWLVQQAQSESQQGAPSGIAGVAPVVARPHSGPIKAPVQPLPVRDPRLPKPGSVILRDYRGMRLIVMVLERGFEWNGQIYSSLTAVAKAVTGAHWNGRLFFGLTRRKRGSK